jgi:hypothetical protein
MGIFSKSSPSDRAAKQQAKLIGKLVKRGIDIDGLITGTEFFDDQTVFTLLYEDRVDVVRLPKFGAMLGSGQGVESYPLHAVSSVGTRNEGVKSFLRITGSGFDEELPGIYGAMPDLARAIKEQKKFLASNA